MSDQNRRDFLGASAKLLIGASALASTSVLASKHGGHKGHGLEIDASTKDTCATCQYWGGMRKLSDAKDKVVAQSMGWCNNPDSMNFQKLTTADHKMKKTGIWRKWDII
jgi:anaerobic selenocysteine-containing dehydrogenase